MDNLFSSNSVLGTLRMLNVYEYYERPRLFSVENEIGSHFVVYWIEETEDHEGWLVIPISRQRLNRFENREIDIRNLLLKQEQKSFFKLDVILENFSENWYAKSKADLNEFILPREGLYITEVTPASLRASNESEMSLATHEVRISKTSEKSSPKLDQVTNIFDNLSALYRGFLDSMNIKGGGIEPIAARPGSFILSFSAEHMNAFGKQFGELSKLIGARGEIIPFLAANQIDMRSFSSLLSSILQSSSNFELNESFSQEKLISIRKSDAEFYLPQLVKVASQHLTSYQVPQANNIRKLILFVELSWAGREITPVSLNTAQRHVAYYRHACKLLGLFEGNGAMTAIGQQIAEADDARKLTILAKCFEGSYCGWAWILWSGADNLLGVNPETADEFLKSNCPTLSENTSFRRASTLRKWCEVFQANYPQW